MCKAVPDVFRLHVWSPRLMRYLNRFQDVDIYCARPIVFEATLELAVEEPAIMRIKFSYNSSVADLNLSGRNKR